MQKIRNTISIILPPVWSQVFLTTARLLKYSLEDLGIRSEILEYEGHLKHNWNIILGWSLFRKPFPQDSRYILYQLEPLYLQHWQERLSESRMLFEKAYAIWDYTRVNQPYLEGLPVQLVPLGYHQRLQEVEFRTSLHEYDVLFVGFLSPRRRELLEKLANYCSLSMQPRWGKEYRKTLAKSKMVLNFHQYDIPTPLEQPRVSYTLNQGAFVLAEISADDPYPWLPTAQYDELIDQTLHYLHDPNRRWQLQQNIFDEFRTMPMTETLIEPLATLDLKVDNDSP